MDNATIGAAVGACIDDSGHNRKTVAKAAHMQASALTRSIQGERTFKSVELAWIADFLGLSIDSLIGRTSLPFAAAARAGGGVNAHLDPELSEKALKLYERRIGLAELGVGSVLSFPVIPPGTSPERTAGIVVQHIRQFVGDGVLGDVDELASAIEEAFGIDVWVTPLQEGIDGYCIQARNKQVGAIIANSTNSPQRIRFTIAHELAHLVCEHNTSHHRDVIDYNSNDPVERLANEIASAILMPRDKLVDRDSWSPEQLAQEAYRFRVAPIAFAARVHSRFYAQQLPTLAGAWPDPPLCMEPYSAWHERNCQERKPRLLLHDLALAYCEKRTTIRPFADLAGIDDVDEAREAARAEVAITA